jgi:hypothetical protein
MATYDELIAVAEDAALQRKAAIALMIAAHGVLQGTPDATDRSYAAAVFRNPHGEALAALRYLVAADNGLTVAQITGASDAAIQTRMDEAFPILADAAGGV